MKPITLLTSCIFITTFFQANARLGETTEKLIGRYGDATRVEQIDEITDARLLWFKYAGFDVCVSLLKGVSQREIYYKPVETFTADELQILLGANSAGKVWVKSDFSGKTYLRKDRAAYAQITEFDGKIAVTIESADFRALSLMKQKAGKGSSVGF